MQPEDLRRQPQSEPQAPGAADIREALELLYDNAALAGCSMARYWPAISSIESPTDKAQSLRSLLLDAIESLRPVRRSPAYSRAERDYEVLSLRYASGLSMDQIAAQLCVGERQVYRDLRRAEEKLTQILQASAPPQTTETVTLRREAMRQELALLRQSRETVDCVQALRAAAAAVEPLAQSRGIDLGLHLPPGPLLAQCSPGVLRTTLIGVLSGVVQCASAGRASAGLALEGRQPTFWTTFSASGSRALAHLAEAVASARALEFDSSLSELSADEWRLTVSLPPLSPRRVLVVEDNPSAAGLYERYLDGTGWQALRLSDPLRAVEVAMTERLDAIILDIMMPKVDGWTVLQNLRLTPQTASIPIVVCSVIHDPALGAALGVSEYLTKPVSRLDLLSALARVVGRQD
ncbi:MAG: response regulator [Anaerolineae bacterium]|nr:response regulator [Anaerolineae bacterium]